MVKEIGIENIMVRDGAVSVGLKAKTENGVVGMSLAFELRKESGISKAVEALEDAINSSIFNTVGIGAPDPEPSKDNVGATA